MRTIKGIQRSLAVTITAFAVWTSVSYAQDTLQFTDARATEEGAIRLTWQSESNTVYRIEYTDQLLDPNPGYTVWNPLYGQYPSHGTNTFWLDTGNYNVDTVIPHPRYTTNRFYRIFNEGTNSGVAPTVTVTSPTNGAVLSGGVNVSVIASTSYPYVTTKLYVDGQEMWPGNDGTNYFINTCEWPNGPHTIFATAKALSDYPGPSGSLGIVVGGGVSSYVPVTFSNLITKVAFSQWFFEPSLGQTQQVTATFAAGVDWTLQIQDANSNTVRTVTGSSNSMVFNWDGTGNGGISIPDGVYTYLFTAQTNGQAYQSQGSGGGGNPPPAPSFAYASSAGSVQPMELFAVPSDGFGAVVPLELYPPGYDTNGLTVFEASWSEVMAAQAPMRASIMDGGTGGETSAYSGPSSESTKAPTRPPTAGTKNPVNSYGLAYWDYPDGRTLGIPGNGQPYPATGHCHLDGSTSSTAGPYEALFDGGSTELALAASFRQKGWKEAFVKADNNLSSQMMRRSDQSYNGGELFTSVTIGVFLSHGSYGTDPDYSAGSSGSKQIYFPSGNPNDSGVNTFNNGWLRMCQFGFGGSLKWMAMGACFSLTDPNYGSMSSVGAIPLKTTHLLCGATTENKAVSGVYQEWGYRLLGPNPATVVQAWFGAGREAYKYSRTNDPPITFRVTGYPECMSDTIATNTSPTNPSSTPQNLVKQDSQVWP